MVSFLVFLAAVAYIVWFFTLISHLKRTDLKDTDRIIWTIILCTLTVLGMVLYWFMAPAGDLRVLSEQELKDHFNAQVEKKNA